MEKKYLAVACYRFIQLTNPQEAVVRLKKFCEGKDILGRIYLSEEGINCQMSGEVTDAEAFMQHLREEPFAINHFNIHTHHEHVFPRLTIKYRPQLVALDCKVDVGNTGTHLPPHAFREMLESSEDKILIDVRNGYESKIGHFEGAELPPLEQFRDFPAYAESLAQTVNKQTKVMMYCTGGIRCELYSALLKEKGFEQVYQLEGGIINYGHQEGDAHWKGKLFVFDDRLAIPLVETSEELTTCHHCTSLCDTYYNCANMDCNNLFLACPTCLHTLKGCCCTACTTSARLRPYLREGNKPFRRAHLANATLSQGTVK